MDVSAEEPFDGNALLLRLAEGLRTSIDADGGEIAHLKMTLDSGGPIGQLSVVSVVSNDSEPDLRESFLDQVPGGSLILNLRAEMPPETLSVLVTDALAAENRLGYGVTLTRVHEEQLRPARPTPTHRISVKGSSPTA